MDAMVVRSLRPGDERAVPDLVAACSERCLRDRFFGFVADPVGRLTDQVREAVWEGCATGVFGYGDALVALAVGIPDRAATVWDLGLLVCDEWQGRGVGTLLLHRLVGEAEAAGVTPVALVEGANCRARRLAVRLRRSRRGGSLRVEIG